MTDNSNDRIAVMNEHRRDGVGVSKRSANTKEVT